MTEPVGRLVATANGQHGAFSTQQAHDSGLPDHVFRGWIKSGLLSPTGVRSYRAATSPATAEADMAALVVDIRPRLWFSFDTGAALLEFETFDLVAPYHITLARGSFVKRANVVVHTSNETSDLDTTRVRGFRVMTPARTIIDLAPHLPRDRLTVVIDSALRDRLTTELQIMERIAALRSQGRAAIPKLLAVLDGAEPSRGGHSWLERRFLELVVAARLPRPTTQQVVGQAHGRTIRVDCRWERTPLVVELLGYRWHRTRVQMQRDAARMNSMVLDGLLPLQFTYDDIVARPSESLAVVWSTLARFL